MCYPQEFTEKLLVDSENNTKYMQKQNKFNQNRKNSQARKSSVFIEAFEIAKPSRNFARLNQIRNPIFVNVDPNSDFSTLALTFKLYSIDPKTQKVIDIEQAFKEFHNRMETIGNQYTGKKKSIFLN